MRYLCLLCLLFGAVSVSTASAADDIAASTRTKVGQVAPDFTATALNGETYTLSKLRGRVVVLSFFATWCPPCKSELPHIEKELWQAMRESGIIVLAAAREEAAATVAPFVKQMGLTFPVIPDPQREIFARYATGYIPRLYLLAPDGTIAAQSVGFDEKEFAVIARQARALLPSPSAK